jgi:hypothetical protein
MSFPELEPGLAGPSDERLNDLASNGRRWPPSLELSHLPRSACVDAGRATPDVKVGVLNRTEGSESSVSAIKIHCSTSQYLPLHSGCFLNTLDGANRPWMCLRGGKKGKTNREFRGTTSRDSSENSDKPDVTTRRSRPSSSHFPSDPTVIREAPDMLDSDARAILRSGGTTLLKNC